MEKKEVKQIDSNWNKSRKWFWVVGIVALVVLAVAVVSVTKGCSELSEAGKKDILVPPDEGFVSKTNKLMSYLLEKTNNVQANNIEKLNQKYPALEFALPYGEDTIAYVEDLRLVGIKSDYIKDPELKMFYDNSILPSLLKRQKEDLGSKFFRIRAKSDKDKGLNIKSISVIKSLFKVSLEKDPWEGKIYGRENKIFPSDSNFVFLSYGGSVLPIKVYGSRNELQDAFEYFTIKIDEHGILMSTNEEIDYYSYHKKAIKEAKKKIQFNIKDAECVLGTLNLCVYKENGKVNIAVNSHRTLSHVVLRADRSAEDSQRPQDAGDAPKIYEYSDGMKIVLMKHTDDERLKIAEIAITNENPMVLLSSLIQSNEGVKRYQISGDMTDLFTQQVIKGLSSNLTNTTYKDDVHLSLDPLLSRELEREIRYYLDSLKITYPHPRDAQWEMSVTVMDMATGEIIAMPFVSDEIDKLPENLKLTRKNPGLVRRYIGSTFKPMLALAAVQTNPDLLNYRLQHCALDTGEQASFLGGKTKSWANFSPHWDCGPQCDMKNFLEKSTDVYPVAIAALALNNLDGSYSNNQLNFNGENSFFTNRNNIKMRDGVEPNNYLFFKNIDWLYDVNSYNEFSDTLPSRSYMWDGLALNNNETFGLDNISPDPTIMGYGDFQGKGLYALRAWALGQGNNYWNCAKLAEAWSRMISKKPIRATFIQRKDSVKGNLVEYICNQRQYEFPREKERINSDWNDFLSTFESAQTNQATFRAMVNAVNAVNGRTGTRYKLYSKTGTPDEKKYKEGGYERVDGKIQYIDLGMYTFALLTPTADTNIRENKDASGVVCIVRILRKTYEEPAGNGVSSGHAVRFMADQGRLKKFLYLTQEYYD